LFTPLLVSLFPISSLMPSLTLLHKHLSPTDRWWPSHSVLPVDSHSVLTHAVVAVSLVGALVRTYCTVGRLFPVWVSLIKSSVASLYRRDSRDGIPFLLSHVFVDSLSNLVRRSGAPCSTLWLAGAPSSHLHRSA
jgi:hypothetical protein